MPDNQKSPYEIYPYSIEKLKDLLSKKSEKSEATPETIQQKLHTVYFAEYFQYLNAQTIVVENNYVDRDYLQDFIGYYASCFHQYGHKCTRLHFFTEVINEERFEVLLQSNPSEEMLKNLNEAYLGFIVVKPLPNTIVGRTCLKTYDENHGRKYPINRSYEANLFGLDLNIESLAFQEQDHVVAACATSALWSVFQGSGKLFQHPILSPVDITKIACDQSPWMINRTLPSEGLNAYQISQAVRHIGLEPYYIEFDHGDVWSLKAVTYAYLNAKIPILLGVSLVDVSPGNEAGKNREEHAVAVTGYCLDDQAIDVLDEQHSILLKSSRMKKIYVHDDQVGPFARMTMDGLKISYASDEENKGQRYDSMKTSWRGMDKQMGSIRAVASIMIIPLYHKVRISFGAILKLIVPFDNLLEELRKQEFFLCDARLEWEIYLTTINDFKTDILNSTLRGDLKSRILQSPMPRFLWRAVAWCRDKTVLELIFDATDIDQGLFLIDTIEHDPNLYRLLILLANNDQFKNDMIGRAGNDAWKIFNGFVGKETGSE